ncbi:MAG: histidinol dehydrogenase, partial [Sphingomonadaceae bacterium]
MPLRLDTREPGFAKAFDALVNARREPDEDVSAVVRDIIGRVKAEGDAAVADYTSRFDRHDLDRSGWAVSKEERASALAGLEPKLREALELAAGRIHAYHAQQRPADSETTDTAGVRMGARWRAVEAAGLYVPGGRASYPSSVLMNAIPAKVAGVERLVMVTPTPGGVINPLVLAAAELAGVDEVWRFGGAQAIAALAFGTDRIRPVDVIVGPGNAWVAEAKRQLYGVV